MKRRSLLVGAFILVASACCMADAQTAYDAARKAYPDPKVRTELDVLAADNGLVAK